MSQAHPKKPIAHRLRCLALLGLAVAIAFLFFRPARNSGRVSLMVLRVQPGPGPFCQVTLRLTNGSDRVEYPVDDVTGQPFIAWRVDRPGTDPEAFEGQGSLLNSASLTLAPGQALDFVSTLPALPPFTLRAQLREDLHHRRLWALTTLLAPDSWREAALQKLVLQRYRYPEGIRAAVPGPLTRSPEPAESDTLPGLP